MGMVLAGWLGYDTALVNTDTETEALRRQHEDDLALVSRAAAGDMVAFEDLVRRYRNDVYALSYHFLKNREEAWDTSQEVFIKAHRALGRYRGEASFKTWILRITANHCKDQFKKRKLDTVVLDETIGGGPASPNLGPDRSLEAQELGKAIDEAVAALPPKHRMAFVLREYEDMSYQEMAAAMRCSLGTVMSRLHHARKKLQQALLDKGMVEGR